MKKINSRALGREGLQQKSAATTRSRTETRMGAGEQLQVKEACSEAHSKPLSPRIMCRYKQGHTSV